MSVSPDHAVPPPSDSRARARELLFDAGPVIGLFLLAVVSAERPRLGAIELGVFLVVLPLLARRRWPSVVLALVCLAAVLTVAETSVPWVYVLAAALASFTVGHRSGDRTWSATTVLALTGFMGPGFLAQDADGIEAIVLPFAALVPTWLVGDVLRTRRLDEARRMEAVERTLREREERLQAAAAEERRHVARELHDVVAHAVSVMVIQAGAARQVLRSSPERSEESMLAVEATGREAMSELRRFLGAMGDDDEAAGVAPQPGIEELSALLARVREAGLPASLEVDGDPRALPSSLDVTVYRIIQEALTNALR
jgi:signal transduction histidine kinase